MSAELRPGDGVGAPTSTSNPDHQPIVPMVGGEPPRCTCGFVGGNGTGSPTPGTRTGGGPLLAEHLRQFDATYGVQS